MDFLIGEAGSRVHREQIVELLCRAASLFIQLSRGTVAGILSRVESPGGNFIQISVCSISVLTDQENLWVFAARIAEKGNDRACPWMPDHLKLPGRSIGEPHDVDIERDDLSRV